MESINPLHKIFHRLSAYESPLSPPSLSRNQPVLSCVARECLYNSSTVINLVKPHLRVILDYAQTYNLMISEHTAVDCSFLELVPTLYRTYENHVTLHALCDPAPSGQRRSRSGTPPTVHCAGPAIIKITVWLKIAIYKIIESLYLYTNILVYKSYVLMSLILNILDLNKQLDVFIKFFLSRTFQNCIGWRSSCQRRCGSYDNSESGRIRESFSES